MKTKINNLAQKIWYKKSPLRFLLWPLSLIFSGVVNLRKIAYKIGLKKTVFLDCPVIIIGNITVGGTGKTPLTIALAHFLREKGLNPGIITRGYKGLVIKPEFVFTDSNPDRVGDEALLLARKSHCSVVACPDRVAAAYFLLQQTTCDIILSDDGMQHLALGRTLEIAVLDGVLGVGNGMLLPAGPLRESKSRLKKVNFCVINATGINVDSSEIYGKKHAVLMYFKPQGLISIKDKNSSDFSALSRKKIHAVAGIGNPNRFFNLLREQGLSIVEHAFVDHHQFVQQDFNFLNADECVIMTEKDAVKCESFADDRYWYVPIHVELPEKFFDAVYEACWKAPIFSIKKGEVSQ